MSIKDIKEWEELEPEERAKLVRKLIERYPSLFCWIIEDMKKCICKEGQNIKERTDISGER